MKLVVIHMGRYNLTLLKKEKVVSNAWSFILEQPQDFEFRAGQYVRIFDPIVGESVFRDFTIASSPFKKQQLVLIIKEGISEYKQHLFALKCGEKLLVDAPLGRFTFNEEDKTPLVMIAGGVGITPFYSMIQFVNEKKLAIPITLIASFSSPKENLFQTELGQYARENKQLSYVLTFTRSCPENWHGERGKISEKLISTYINDVAEQIFLISGSPSFVIDMEDLLIRMGINSRQIKVEVFLGFN